MRKLMSKKGFTLVELMIVVVILGILVAVAVPIFSAVTKNAKIKACKSNVRVIKGNLENYQATGNNGEEVEFDTGDTTLSGTGATATPAELMKLFDGGKFPQCEGTDYTIIVNKTTAGIISYKISCNSGLEDHPTAA